VGDPIDSPKDGGKWFDSCGRLFESKWDSFHSHGAGISRLMGGWASPQTREGVRPVPQMLGSHGPPQGHHDDSQSHSRFVVP